MMMNSPIPGEMARTGMESAPPRPASHAPRTKTQVKSRDERTPSARAISRSAAVARMIRPTPVFSRKSQRPSPTSPPTARMKRWYVGKTLRPMITAPDSAAGVGGD